MASFLRHSGSASTLLLRLIAKPVNVQKFSTSSFSSSYYSAAALTLVHMKKNQPTLVSSPSSSSFSLFSNPHHLSNLNSNSQQLAERKRFYAIRADLKEHLDKVIKDNKLVLFMKGTPNEPRCGFSRAVVQILGINGVDVSAIKSFNVLDDEELRTSIKEYSDWPTIPQVYIEGEFVGGCDIMIQLHQNGELVGMLKKAGLELKPQEQE